MGNACAMPLHAAGRPMVSRALRAAGERFPRLREVAFQDVFG